MKIFSSLLVLLFTAALFAKDFDFNRKLVLSADGLEKFSIDCGSGFLAVEGSASKEIKVDVEIVIDGINESKAQKIVKESLNLSLEKSGSRGVLVCKFDNLSWINALRGNNMRADVTVNMPAALILDVEDSSGSMEISGIKNDVQIQDGSGSIKVDKIKGRLEIDDNSGSVTVKEITGSLYLEDGSGGIDIENVNGDIKINDGSGSMEIRDVKGNARIRDGSGSITIDGVTENVTISEAGSGGVSIRNVDGKVFRDDN
jgi:DUF4097 and DUF4098 domain-containing protein YvlB